jgi:hypothetical protein
MFWLVFRIIGSAGDKGIANRDASHLRKDKKY